ncbi:MAG: hypothetical protein COW65_02595 [Cytophagales bacterium CG18_big_fil_WC_8_21_14_2_50_42_9]|nr:MAG: hypothetical protein COW65_02595 [Cytophagales bacterium CG18_big_fil_WC_8_21_14_2_50_42_9]
MKSINILTGLALLCLAGTASAQNQVDALRYSQLGLGGTARVQGIGGAQAALGADAGNLAGNPAGLGMFRRSEFTFSPGVHFNNTTSQLEGNESVDQRNNLNVSSLGVVFSNRKSDGTEGNWRGGAFGIGFTRQNDFQNKFNYQRGTEGFTIAESIADDASAYGLSTSGNLESLEDIAYETYLIDYFQDEDRYYETPRSGIVRQSEDVISRGGQNQLDFSYGASYRDRFYLGAGIGIGTIRYNQERIFRESETDPSTAFESLTLRDEFTTTGTGINAKIGFIYRPSDFVRIGANIQTPTYYAMHDSYYTALQTTIASSEGNTHSAETDPGEYDYSLTTPLRATAGVAILAGKYGFLTGDVEYVDYSKARLADNESSSEFSGVNNTISTEYKSAVNVKVGAEGRLDILRVRAGVALFGDPYQNTNYDRQRTYITGGVGIKQQNYFVDLTLVNSKYNSVYSPYTIADQSQPVVTTKNRDNNVMLTLGVNF